MLTDDRRLKRNHVNTRIHETVQQDSLGPRPETHNSLTVDAFCSFSNVSDQAANEQLLQMEGRFLVRQRVGWSNIPCLLFLHVYAPGLLGYALLALLPRLSVWAITLRLHLALLFHSFNSSGLSIIQLRSVFAPHFPTGAGLELIGRDNCGDPT